MEYYDLPYRYNQTMVKILAQTPTTLFIYWDIADEDREQMKKQYGDMFFEQTKPVLLIHNSTKNYSFEVEINDYANSWYLTISDTKCDYQIELGRRWYSHNPESSDFPHGSETYIPITSSNKIETPNDHVLFEKEQQMIYFQNVKTNTTHSKEVAKFHFLQNMGKIYHLQDLYHELYQENLEEFDLSNPSSGNPTSTFK